MKGNGVRSREWSGWAAFCIAALAAVAGPMIMLANDRQALALDLQDHESRLKAVEIRQERADVASALALTAAQQIREDLTALQVEIRQMNGKLQELIDRGR